MRCCELAKSPKRYLMRKDLGVSESQGEGDPVMGGSGDLIAVPDSQVAEGLMEHNGLADDNFVEARAANDRRRPTVTCPGHIPKKPRGCLLYPGPGAAVVDMFTADAEHVGAREHRLRYPEQVGGPRRSNWHQERRQVAVYDFPWP